MPTRVKQTKISSSVSSAVISGSATVESDNALLLVFINAIQASTTPSDRWLTGCTIGGAAAVELINLKGTSTNRRYASGLYYLTGVPAGTTTVEYTYSDSFNRNLAYVVEVIEYAPSPIAQQVSALSEGSTTTSLISVTTGLTDSLWLGSSRTQGYDKTLTPASGCTEHTEAVQNFGASDTAAVVANLISRSGAGTYNLGSSWSGSIQGGGLLGVEILPAPSGLRSFPYFYRQRQ
jgi:hypothetical protein